MTKVKWGSTLKKKNIAKNPLSENLARLLGYYDHSPRGFREIIVSKSLEIEKVFPGETLSPTTILSWIEVDEEKCNPTRAKRMPGIDNLALLAKVLDINPWDLFIPDKCLNLDKIDSDRRSILEVVSKIERKHLKGVRAYLCAIIEGEYEKTGQTFYRDLLNLISDHGHLE